MNDNKELESLDILKILRDQKAIKLSGNLYYYTQITFAYNTNHIEGSKLTEEQTQYIYETNTLISDKETSTNIDDIFEMANHFRLVDYMLDIADKALTEEMIKEFHKILKSGTSDSAKEWFNVGDYKKLANEVGGMETTKPNEVAKAIGELLEQYNSKASVTINDIVDFHAKFEKIHPFQDGNGRVGRIIMFKECLKNNIVPFIIMDKDKAFYYRGLREYNQEPGYLIDTCLNAQDQYIEAIKKFILNK